MTRFTSDQGRSPWPTGCARARVGPTGTPSRKLDYTDRLGEITHPVLLRCGVHDPQFPVACSRQLAAGIAGSRLVLFEPSGHYPFIEERDRFWTAVAQFLSGTLRPAPR